MKVDEVKYTPDQNETLKLSLPIRVTRVAVSCHGCPKSWEGVTEEGDEVYARYRWGFLRINITRAVEGGEPIEESVFGCQVDKETPEESAAKYAEMRRAADNGCKFPSHQMIDGMEQSDKVMREFMAGHPEMSQDHSYHGSMEYDELRRLTKDWFIWPESESES